MHSDNAGAGVLSKLVPTDVPGPGGLWMLHFQNRGTEGGVIQKLPWGDIAKKRLMFSVWVKVRIGQVFI